MKLILEIEARGENAADLTEALKTSKQSFIEKIDDFENADTDIMDAFCEEVTYIGKFKNVDTGKVEKVYSDKNGLLTI